MRITLQFNYNGKGNEHCLPWVVIDSATGWKLYGKAYFGGGNTHIVWDACDEAGWEFEQAGLAAITDKLYKNGATLVTM